MIDIALFLLVIVGCFYLPGTLLVKRLKLRLSSLENIFFATVIGMMIFVLLSYIFSWLGIWYLIIPILLIADIFCLKRKRILPCSFRHENLLPLFLISVLALLFSLNMVMVGIHGDSIFSRRDDSWHLALINELRAHFPPDNPGFAGVPLKGYHYFYNFLLAKVSQVFPLSPPSLHFHFFPLLMAFLWGIGVYLLMYKWSRDRRAALWAVFLTQFGGSFSFILHLKGHTGSSLDSAFGISQPATSLINPPFSISIVILITALFALYQYLDTRQNNWLVPLILCGGLITMFKVYAGMIFLGGFMLLVLLEFFKKRFGLLKAFLVIIALFFGTYGVLADHSARLLFYPFWAPHKVLLDNMPWYGYEEKHYTYSKYSVIRGLIKIEVYALYVFIIGNLGTRVVGLLGLPLKNRKLPSLFSLTLLAMLVISFLTPLFFIQTGKVFEIIQMAWYFLFFSALFASLGLSKLFSLKYSRILKFLFFATILITTLPSAYEKYKTLAAISTKRTSLSTPYFKAMQFLRLQGSYENTVLEIPAKRVTPTEEDLRRWYKGSSPAIVAFSNKRSFLNYQFIDFPGTDPALRINFLQKILLFNKFVETGDDTQLQKEVEDGLLKNKISFIYSPYPLICFEKIGRIRQIYQNQGTSIYRVYEN